MHESISDRDFKRLGETITQECGIKMPPVKKVMLEARLRKRLRALGMETFKEYCEYLFSPEGKREELIHMIDVVTTNKTEFFREPAHFDFLLKTALPDMVENKGVGIRRDLRVWSAGCATGEEPYTLAMLLDDFFKSVPGPYSFHITATDISLNALETARLAIYDHHKILPVPVDFKKKYLLRSKDKTKKAVRVVPKLRSRVSFNRLNFMDENYGFRESMDVIFCRNVIIYFDKHTQQKMLKRVCDNLGDKSYLFMGHSETLHGIEVPLKQMAPSTYRKKSV